MLIRIINCTPSKYENDEERQLALLNLLTSHGTKKNILTAENGVFEDIIESSIYGRIHKNYAHEALINKREYGALRKELAIYLNIDFTNNVSKCVQMNETYIISLGHKIFSSPENSNGTGLLTENALDSKIYKIIAKYYSSVISKSRMNFFFQDHLGAGSHSKSEFDRLSGLNRILLCLVDNDKPHPNKGEGSTSKRFSKTDREYNNNALASVISAREIENIIPTKTLENTVLTFSRENIDKLDEISKFNRKNNQFRRYFDHKNGISLKDAINLDRQYGNFWLDVLSIDKRFSSKECFKKKICTACDDCPKISGLGDKLLSNVVNKSQNEHIRNLFNPIDDFLLDDWKSLGHLLVSWGCCTSGKISRAS